MNNPDNQYFDPKLFLEVVKVNMNIFSNSVMTKAESKAAMTGRRIMTEDETRGMARDYFTKMLAHHLNEKL